MSMDTYMLPPPAPSLHVKNSESGAKEGNRLVSTKFILMRYYLIPYKLRLKTLARILRRDDEALEQLELVKTRI